MAVKLDTVPRSVDVDLDGRSTEGHIGDGHWSVPGTPHHGEFTLCGRAIDYSTYGGRIDDAPTCKDCERMDG